jgi:exodeoxyribonuclease V beta subunit
MTTTLDTTSTQLVNGLFIEASAGTGKTYSIAALVAREIALTDSLRIADILITTFTRNSAAELRDRVRRRLIATASQLLSDNVTDDDELVAFLRAHPEQSIADQVQRLQRAAVEFDMATVSTIHSVCTKILTLAGITLGSSQNEIPLSLLVKQKVNDAVIEEAMAGRIWDSKRLAQTVETKLRSFDALLWISPHMSEPEQADALAAKELVLRVVTAVNEATKSAPTFDDLLRLAADVISDNKYRAVQNQIKERFRIAFVDEAQDTDPLQWSIFRGIIPDTASDSVLVVVGDPKQSIYRFRGADVDQYIAQRNADTVVSLATNYRSDQHLVSATNRFFSGAQFGGGISYVPVSASTKNSGRTIGGVEPLEVINLGQASSQDFLIEPAAHRVAQLLQQATLNGNKLNPSDICVLVRSGSVGVRIERQLRRLRIPAVSGGTASVMNSEVASHLVFVLQALEKPTDVGRARKAAGTMFFGRSLLDPHIISDGGVDTELELLHSWSDTLRHSGVASLGAAMLDNPTCIQSMLSSRDGERRLTDFRHIIDLLHSASQVGPTDAAHVLLRVAELSEMDETSELVSRRVESDAKAVQIMTIHGAKGLQFPVVVVADLWKPKPGNQRKTPAMFLGTPDPVTGIRTRNIDVAWVLSGSVTDAAGAYEDAETAAEALRLFYVAMTRAEHHVSLFVPSPDTTGCVAYECISQVFLNEPGEGAALIHASTIPVPTPLATAPASTSLHVASAPADIKQTYRRTSFSGITAIAEQRAGHQALFGAAGHGNDESAATIYMGHAYALADTPTGVPMPLARIPGGTALGNVLHTIFEHWDPSVRPIHGEFARLVAAHADSPLLRSHHTSLVTGLEAVVTTPLGPRFANKSLAEIPASDRLAELAFEMSVAELSKNVLASDIGRVLINALQPSDALYSYAVSLTSAAFNIPLAGILNGSIDAVLRVSGNEHDTLFITDYKSNRLDTDDDTALINAYAPSRLVSAMADHHYPLQALLYGTALHRFLRWRAPHLNSDDVIGGIAYLFLRGMTGPLTPTDEHGNPYGVFQWHAPAGLWAQLSNRLAGDAI